MHSRWFNTAVIMLWLATMSWLVKAKLLPSLLIGDPPNYSKIVEAQRDAPPVGWRMTLGGQPLGWALSDTKLLPTGLTEIYGRVHFEALPLEEIMPTWLRSLTHLIRQPVKRLRMDAWSVLTIDPLGHLERFNSSMRVDPFQEMIRVRGTVDKQQLRLEVHSGDASFNYDVFLPSDALLCDVLSPQTRLPGLRAGQEWTMPVYSPLWTSKNPLEIVHAKVEALEPITWNGETVRCWLVVYRGDLDSGADVSRHPRGKLWARRDGAVLRQQVFLFDSVIRFDRLPDDEAAELAEAAGRQWWSGEDDVPDESRWDDYRVVTPGVYPFSTGRDRPYEESDYWIEPAVETEDDLWDTPDD